MEFLSGFTTAFLFGTGAFFIIRLKGFFYLHPLRSLKGAYRIQKQAAGKGGISPFRGLCMALAGTLGVGNIAGVASALWMGGPGAVFWMIFSGLVVMVLKYAEISLAIRHRRNLSDGSLCGGAPYYISDSLSRRGHPRAGHALATVFALLCLINALTMGSVLQMNAAAGAMQGAFGLSPLVTGATMALICAVTAAGGSRRIASFTQKLVPVMTVGFLCLCGAVLILRRERLPEAVISICKEALKPRAAGAGVLGFLLSRAVRAGVMRGLVSNEAGCGTAPMAHAAARTESAAAQGMMGVIEVFVDTVLLCTVTALCILVSDSGMVSFGADGVRTAQAAFTSVLGEWAGKVFGVSVWLFAAATVFCWAHYGLTCVNWLTDRHPGKRKAFSAVFTAAFCISQVLGAISAPALAWSLADVAIGLMTILNLSFLLLENKEIKEETEAFTSMCTRHSHAEL